MVEGICVSGIIYIYKIGLKKRMQHYFPTYKLKYHLMGACPSLLSKHVFIFIALYYY